jgi:hypothetical protein
MWGGRARDSLTSNGDTDTCLVALWPLGDDFIPFGVPHAVRHVATLRPVDGACAEVTTQDFGHSTTEARDVSRPGLEQCMDNMELMFRRGSIHRFGPTRLHLARTVRRGR